jgi:hypothetical protein
MLVKFESSSVRETKWSEYATRFIFGGTVTLLAGVIADRFGPGIGGLFLAFPAIFRRAPPSSKDISARKKKGPVWMVTGEDVSLLALMQMAPQLGASVSWPSRQPPGGCCLVIPFGWY